MPIRLFNSLTKTKEDLIPLKGKTINMYSCGVTVYDACHIGHARSLYVFDVIRRYLKFRGYAVHFVRNITDVDDKIINKANELGKTSDEVASANIQAYYEDLKAMGIDKADSEPRATENIKDMVKDIEGLIKKGFAYEVKGDVYYQVRKFKDYGKLSGQSIDKMMDAVRIEPGDRKKDPLDFALWKRSKEGEPAWDSPWGKGRPGWHIECSCMSLKHLKCETLDIHAGGRDLIFPHHENEIAQAEGLTGKMFAKYWIHHGLLTINSQKMAKSLGNFITIEDTIKKHSVDTLKMLYLLSHYASPVDYSEEKMLEAKKALDRIDILFWKAAEIVSKGTDPSFPDIGKNRGLSPFIETRKAEFIEAMDDDFNTARAIASIFELLNDTNKYIDQEKANPNYKAVIVEAVNTIEGFLKNIFGLFSSEPKRDLSEVEELLLEQRMEARKNRDFKRSDDLRDALKAKGIIVEDGKAGQTWRWA